MFSEKEKETGKSILNRCVVCGKFIHLLGENKTADPSTGVGIKYFSEECRRIDLYEGITTSQQPHEKPEPVLHVISDEELETLLDEPTQPKALSYVSDNHLFYSILQVIGHLDQTKKAVFQKGWEDYYRTKITQLGETSNEGTQFHNFFSAFDQYINKLWNPKQQIVGQKMESATVSELSGAEIVSEDLQDILTNLSNNLNFLTPCQQLEDSTKNQNDKDEEQDEDYDLSSLNWLYLDLSKYKIPEKTASIRYTTTEGKTLRFDVKLRHLNSHSDDNRIPYKMVTDLAIKNIKELADKDYWITEKIKEKEVNLIHPYSKIDLDQDHFLILQRKVEPSPPPINCLKAVVLFNLQIDLLDSASLDPSTEKLLEKEDDPLFNTSTIKTMIISTNLNGKLEKLKPAFREELSTFLQSFISLGKNSDVIKRLQKDCPIFQSILKRSNLEVRLNLVLDLFCAEMD